MNLDQLRWRRQWVVGTGVGAPTAHFQCKPLSTHLCLWHHNDAIVQEFTLAGIRCLLIGAAAMDDRVHGLHTDTAYAGVPEWLDNVAGVYSVITVEPNGRTLIYTDPGGLANVFYRDGVAASTPGLLGPLERDPDIDSQYRFGGSDNWYAGATTPFIGVRYLLANHSLDLESGETRRFWPRTPGFPSTPPGDGVERMAATLTCGLRNLAKHNRNIVLSITGGRDSRVNLACFQSSQQHVRTFTLLTPQFSASERSIVQQLLNASTGVSHEWITVTDPSTDVTALYDEISAGMATGERRRVVGTCLRAFPDPGTIHVNGNLGAIFKSFYWPENSIPPVSIERLAREFVQRPPCIIDGLRTWLDSVPLSSPSDVYNLMYLEQRGGRWMGIGERAGQLVYDSYAPFCSRRVFSLLCGMPKELQRNGILLNRVIDHLAPKFASIPYHSGTSTAKRLVPKYIKQWIKRLTRTQ